MLQRLNTEIKAEIKRDIYTSEIEGTAFVKFEDIQKTVVGDVVSEKTRKGITLKSLVDVVTGLEKIVTCFKLVGYGDNPFMVVAIKQEDYTNVMCGKKHICDVVSRAGTDSSDVDLYIWYSYNQTLFDMNLNIIPLPILVDSSYLVNEEYYDLEKLLCILQKDTRVLDRDKLRIESIHYCNQEEGQTQTIKFKCLLDKSDYARVQEEGVICRKKLILDEFLDTKGAKKKDLEGY